MPQDYLLNDDMDLRIEGGDFVKGESTNQHQTLLLVLEKGELRQYPKTGVGSQSFINDEDPGGLYNEIQEQFTADGMDIRKLIVSQDGKVEVTAPYRE